MSFGNEFSLHVNRPKATILRIYWVKKLISNYEFKSNVATKTCPVMRISSLKQKKKKKRNWERNVVRRNESEVGGGKGPGIKIHWKKAIASERFAFPAFDRSAVSRIYISETDVSIDSQSSFREKKSQNRAGKGAAAAAAE